MKKINKQKNGAKKNQTKKWHVNLFDAVSVGIIVFLVALGIFAFVIYEEPKASKNIYVTVRVPAENIETEAKNQKTVFLNSVNKAVEVSAVRKDGDFLLITLTGPGEIKEDYYLFNGQRILVGQKSEIHSTYFAQGKVTSVSDEFK